MARNLNTVIEVCVGLHCSINGSYSLLEDIRSHYNLQIGVPSNDGMLLKEIECVHNCYNAAIVIINNIEYTNVSFNSIIKYIEAIHVKIR